MALIYTYDGGAITHKVAPSGISLTHRADMGEASFGGIPIEDPAASLTMVGHKTFTVEEDDCAQPRLFTGWTTERGIGRDLDRGMFVGPNPRLHDTTIVDINAAFGFRQITGADGNRPDETWIERLTWILESDYLDDAISHSEDFIVTNTTAMDAADYRGSAPSAVMDDLSDRSGNAYTYFLFWDPAATAITLFFDNPTSFIAASTLSISNVYADVDNATCFAPDSVAKLAREPDQTYSEVVLEYNNGTQKLFRKRPSTETAFIRRGTTIQRPYTKSVATATSQAEKWLDKHSTEVDRITCSIQVPSSAAGLVQAGQSISVRFSHMPGYAEGATMRVVSCSPKPTNDVADFYDIALELVGVAATPTAGCTFAWPVGEVTPTPLDVFGSSRTTLHFIPAASLYPSTRDLDGFGPADHDHEPNSADGADGAWGVHATVWSRPNSSLQTWTWDLFDAGLPAICAAQLSPGSAYGAPSEGIIKHDHVQASNDGTNWTDMYDAIQDNYDNIPVHFFDQPYPEYRYWRIYHYFEDTRDGLSYYPGIDYKNFMLWEGDPSPGAGDTVIPLPPAPGSTTEHTTDPTVDDDAPAGYTVGSVWVNTDTGSVFILVDSTDGAAVWVPTTIETLNEGTSLTMTTGSLNFVGSGVTATTVGNDVTVTIGGLVGATFNITAVFDGGTEAITGNPEVDVVIPAAGTITGYTLFADAAGDAVIDIWNDVYGVFPPTDADTITAAAPPTLATAIKATDSTLTGWDKALAAGDILRFHLDSSATVKRLELTLTYTRS